MGSMIIIHTIQICIIYINIQYDIAHVTIYFYQLMQNVYIEIINTHIKNTAYIL